MNRTQLVQWLERTYATADSELDCDQLQAILPAFVDLEIAGAHPADRFPLVPAHFAQCPDCAEEYEGLRQVARLEAQHRLPEAEESLNQFEASPVLKEGELI